MTSVSNTVTAAGKAPGFWSKERCIAATDYNRWLVPPAALAIHLCIGMAYGFSVFWLPLSKALPTTAACATDTPWWQLLQAPCNWRIPSLSFTFTLFIVVLGLSAALWGKWLERAGPRKAGAVAALCWSGGLALGAAAVYLHQLWLLWLGTGILGGIGLGIGYISPVSTLIKWFPDRRGMATGMAIMGFGGGAMIGAPLAVMLMKHFSAATGDGGVAPTLLVLALVYFVFMMGGALGYRLPSPGWHPPATALSGTTAFATTQHVHLNRAWKTPQFWLVWGVLCMNVTAGIGVLSMASPMLQEVFGGRLIGTSQGFADLSAAQKTQIAAIAAGFTGLLSLFNIFGRFFWASISDWIGRKSTYYCFFLLGIALYALTPALAHRGEIALFVAAFCVILSMYGGGFSTVPAYLADLFGTQMVGAIHGRLLTAWSAAGVIGPVLIAQLREFELAHGVPNSLAYDTTFYTLTGFLVLGLICNLLVRRTPAHYMMTPEELAAEQAIARDVQIAAPELPAPRGSSGALLLAWLAVGVPIAWGVWMTLQKAVVLFR